MQEARGKKKENRCEKIDEKEIQRKSIEKIKPKKLSTKSCILPLTSCLSLKK
jgi:hypothetical protein